MATAHGLDALTIWGAVYIARRTYTEDGPMRRAREHDEDRYLGLTPDHGVYDRPMIGLMLFYPED